MRRGVGVNRAAMTWRRVFFLLLLGILIGLIVTFHSSW
jgi:hypothetical protein